MPLPSSAPRELKHTRAVTCHGYQREDGLFDIEGRMTDSKTYDIDNQDRGGQIKAGEYIHDMSIRLTLDLDFLIHQVEAVIDDSPFNACPRISERFKQLEGVRIAPGWNAQIRRMFAGTLRTDRDYRVSSHRHSAPNPRRTTQRRDTDQKPAGQQLPCDGRGYRGGQDSLAGSIPAR